MSGQFDSGFWSRGFWPEGFWPQDFWPDLPMRIAAWVADALEDVQDPDESLTLRVIRPTIVDWEESHYANGDVILVGIDENIDTETTTPTRLSTALLKLYGIIRVVPDRMSADTMLSRMAETIRRTLLAGNSRSRACDGIALNIDCPRTAFANSEGLIASIVDVEVKYFPG